MSIDELVGFGCERAIGFHEQMMRQQNDFPKPSFQMPPPLWPSPVPQFSQLTEKWKEEPKLAFKPPLWDSSYKMDMSKFVHSLNTPALTASKPQEPVIWSKETTTMEKVAIIALVIFGGILAACAIAAFYSENLAMFVGFGSFCFGEMLMVDATMVSPDLGEPQIAAFL